MCFAFKRNQPEERQQGPELGMAVVRQRQALLVQLLLSAEGSGA